MNGVHAFEKPISDLFQDLPIFLLGAKMGYFFLLRKRNFQWMRMNNDVAVEILKVCLCDGERWDFLLYGAVV